MYITNPTQEQLDGWYRCGVWIADYLVEQGLPIIHLDRHHYYFVKTEQWLGVYSRLPWYLKFLDYL